MKPGRATPGLLERHRSRLMGDIHDMLEQYARAEAELSQRTEGVASFLRANRVPVALQERIRGWIRFRLTRDRADAQVAGARGARGGWDVQ